MRFIAGLLVCLIALPVGAAPDAEPLDNAHRTGAFRVTMSERSPLSKQSRLQDRLFADRLGPQHADYDLTEETFRVVVPEAYTADEPHGLIVWISPNESGRPAPQWAEVLARHKLLWIGADDAGNERPPWQRMGLPLDALAYMQQRYTLDDERIYLAGVSGGGRCASRLAVTHPEVFDGALPIVGVDFFEPIEVPDKPGFVYPHFKRPRAPILQHAREHLRLVILTGENDPNRDQCELFAAQYRRHNFQHVVCVEAPDMGHEYPPAQVLSQALDRLDAPLFEARAAAAEQGDADADDEAPPAKAAKSPAREKLDLARNYVAAGQLDLARDELQAILAQHPDTREARLARTMLDAMDE
jgi:dienelactone hydrolase